MEAKNVINFVCFHGFETNCFYGDCRTKEGLGTSEVIIQHYIGKRAFVMAVLTLAVLISRN